MDLDSFDWTASTLDNAWASGLDLQTVAQCASTVWNTAHPDEPGEPLMDACVSAMIRLNDIVKGTANGLRL